VTGLDQRFTQVTLCDTVPTTWSGLWIKLCSLLALWEVVLQLWRKLALEDILKLLVQGRRADSTSSAKF
jgi:hypothetical protein